MASEDFGARLKSLITRFGFRPDEVSVSSQFGVGTISFKNQKGKATELVSKLRGAMKQMGVPEAAITAREVQYPADADGPAEHWGVVNVDFNKMPHSRPGEKDMMAEDKYGFVSYGLAIESDKGLRYNAVGFRTREAAEKNIKDEIKKYVGEHGLRAEIWGNLPNWAGQKIVKTLRFSRSGAKATFKVEDRFYFGKGRKERFADDRLAKFLEVYNRNEDNNYHSENVVLLAKFLGSTDDVAQAQRIANEQRRSSDGISEKLYKERTELNRRLLSKFRSRYPQADI